MSLHPNLSRTVLNVMGMHITRGDFGIELEIEGTKLPQSIPGWVAKKEDSLRGEALEYVTKGAVPQDGLMRSLTVMHKHLTADGCKVDISKRASTHIHLNMQQETIKTVLGYALAWTMIEPVILRLCGPQRNGNLFCMNSLETGDLPMWMYRARESINHSRFPFHNWPQRGKYAALNIDPIKSFGTVEARCFPITIDPEQIAMWAKWMMNIKTMVRDWPDETYASLIDYAYNEPNDFIGKIMTGARNVFSSCAPNNPYDLVHAGVEIAWEGLQQAKPVFYYEKQKKEKADTDVGVPLPWPTDEPPTFTDYSLSEDY